MDKTYWNEEGKYQAFCDAALDKTPTYGMTNNVYMNALIAISHVYYDVYNNGGGNIEDVYKSEFKRCVTPLFPDIDIHDFIYGNQARIEAAMDRVLEFLQDKNLDCEIYTVWFSYKNQMLSHIQPQDLSDGNWSTVTFGSPADMQQWCEEQMYFCNVKDVTQEQVVKHELPNEQEFKDKVELPQLCYSVNQTTGEIIILENGVSGYYPTIWPKGSREENEAIVEDLNKKLGVSEAQVKAMEFGSLFGWDKPGANPMVYMKKSLQEKIAGAEAKTAGQTTNSPEKKIAEPQR